MIPNAHKLPRIWSALLVMVFTSFLIIFCIKYLIICEKMLSFKVEVYLFYTFYFVIYFNYFKFLKYYFKLYRPFCFPRYWHWLSKTIVGQTLVFVSQNELGFELPKWAQNELRFSLLWFEIKSYLLVLWFHLKYILQMPKKKIYIYILIDPKLLNDSIKDNVRAYLMMQSSNAMQEPKLK